MNRSLAACPSIGSNGQRTRGLGVALGLGAGTGLAKRVGRERRQGCAPGFTSGPDSTPSPLQS
jgi:hypothetical protein